MSTAIAQRGDTIESLVWRERRAAGAMVANTMQLNPGLAERYPLTLPAGHPVTLPDVAAVTPVVATVNLWS